MELLLVVGDTCVDFGLGGILHSFVLDDVVRNLAADQGLHVRPLQGHHGAGRFQERGQAQAKRTNTEGKSVRDFKEEEDSKVADDLDGHR